MDRSYLFAPGHNAKLLDRVFDAGADAVMLDLEDAVPPEAKATARAMVAEVLADHPAWVRVNAAQTAWCEADLAAVAEHAFGIRIPKVESAADVAVGHRPCPGQADHLRHRKRPRCARRAGDRRGARVSGSWRWAGWTCSAT